MSFDPQHTAPPLPDTPTAIPRARLLIVDDQPINIQTLHRIFQGDHEVFMATSGEQALQFCRSQRLPDMILLDIVMPGMDGGDVVAELRRHSQTANIPVVMLTALVARNEVSRHSVAEAGELIMLGKPIDMATLVHCIEEQLYLHGPGKPAEGGYHGEGMAT